MLWSHEQTSPSSSPSFITSSTDGMVAPEAARNHEAIGSTPLSANGGVVPTVQVHWGQVYHRTRSPCLRKAMVIHPVQNKCRHGSRLYWNACVSPGNPVGDKGNLHTGGQEDLLAQTACECPLKV